MHSYPHHIGDWNTATMYLTRLERSVYREALDIYYDTEGPLDGTDFDRLARRVRCVLPEEKDALKFILDEFFEFDIESGLYVHHRCERELASYRAGQEQRAEVKKGVNLRQKNSRGVRKAMFAVLRERGVGISYNAGMDEMRAAFKEHCPDVDLSRFGHAPVTANQLPKTKNQEIPPNPPAGGAGDQTQSVYNWVRSAQTRIPSLRAIKGDNNDSRAIVGPSSLQEVNHRGRKVKHGIKLWLVGVDNAKDLLLGQLAIAEAGPGYVHTSTDLKREWYEQLTAEQRILTKMNGKDTYKWVKRRPRNEVLDCRNYALHAAMAHSIHKWPESKWLQLEQAVQPPQDLFSTSPAQEQGAQPSAPATPAPLAVAQPATSAADEDIFAPISLQ